MVTAQPSLVRAIGRWSLTAAVINNVVGSGIFGLPSPVAGLVGAWSPLAVLFSGTSILIIVLCFAEVGSRFDEAGGPYLYAREAFGPAAGFQIGWLHIWTRLLAGAAVLNLLVSYLDRVVPGLATPAGRAFLITVSMILVTAANVAGVRTAAWVVNGLTIAKLLPLFLLITVGLFQLRSDVFATQAVSNPNWTEAVLLLVFAYGGFESAVIAASETRDPKRDTAFALLVGMMVITLVYCLVQLVVVGVLPNAAESTTPVASALGQMLGGIGSMIGSLAVVVSIFGWLMGFALMTPRIIFSMAQRREMPAFLSAVHPRYRTPAAAITINSVVVLAFALYSSFTQAATLSAIVRLCIFATTCAAVLRLRARVEEPAPFKVPGAWLVPVTGIAFCIWLLSTRSFAQAWILLSIMLAGVVVWASGRKDWFSKRTTAP
jgi:APA family basic amino acid/polyamine antiporter